MKTFSYSLKNELFLAPVQLASSSDSSKGNTASSSNEEYFLRPSTYHYNNKKSVIFTDRLQACLDKCMISDRVAMHIITAVIDSLGENIENFVLNRKSLHMARENHRSTLAEAKQNDFHVIYNFNSLI